MNDDESHVFSDYMLELAADYAGDGYDSMAQRYPESAFPMGANEGRSLVINFGERMRYKNGSYFDDLPKPIDILYDKVYYGKVDRFQNAIVPKCQTNALLKQVSQENIFVFDFVADNFFLLKRNLKIAGDQGHIEKRETKLFEIEATSAWFKYGSVYDMALNNVLGLYRGYLVNYVDVAERNKIRNFEDYVNGFLSFLKTSAYKGPVTLTRMVLSSGFNARASGLVVNIDKGRPFGSDLDIYTNYLQDINFSYYARAARKYGFYVDRNGPWRLFADPFSPPMIKGLAERGITKDRFFDTYYDRTYTLDLNLLKTGLWRSWNLFASRNTRIFHSVPGTLKCPPRQEVLASRAQVSKGEVFGMSDLFWYEYYINVRSWETGVKYPDHHFHARQAVNADQAYGTQSGILGIPQQPGLLYLNNLFKPYLYDERLFKKHLTGDDNSSSMEGRFDVTSAVYGSGGG